MKPDGVPEFGYYNLDARNGAAYNFRYGGVG